MEAYQHATIHFEVLWNKPGLTLAKTSCFNSSGHRGRGPEKQGNTMTASDLHTEANLWHRGCVVWATFSFLSQGCRMSYKLAQPSQWGVEGQDLCDWAEASTGWWGGPCVVRDDGWKGTGLLQLSVPQVWFVKPVNSSGELPDTCREENPIIDCPLWREMGCL